MVLFENVVVFLFVDLFAFANSSSYVEIVIRSFTVSEFIAMVLLFVVCNIISVLLFDLCVVLIKCKLEIVVLNLFDFLEMNLDDSSSTFSTFS